jgi:hypothetical protein
MGVAPAVHEKTIARPAGRRLGRHSISVGPADTANRPMKKAAQLL